VDIDYSVLQSENAFGGTGLTFDLNSEYIFQVDPELDENYLPINTSITIDAGIDLGFEFTGLAPDLGYKETIFSTGIEEKLRQEEVLVFPNPVSDGVVYLSMDVNYMELLDVNGRRVMAKREKSRFFHLPSGIAPGTYLLKLNSSSGTILKKLLVAH